MSKPYADIPGYKKLDAAIREAASAHLAVIRELDKAQSARRTQAELAALQAVRVHAVMALDSINKARHTLWEGVG